MNKALVGTTVGFILGGVAGAFAGYFFGKNKFQAQADKEVESVKQHLEQYYSNKSTSPSNEEKEIVPPKKPTPAPLVDPEKEKYNRYSGMYKGESIPPEGIQPKTTIHTNTTPKEHKSTTPYVITPDQYNDSEYESVQLIWYSDKVLADTDGNIIHNINEVVGPEALSTFGRYLDDTVYVRDDDKKIDYDIAWSPKKYSSISRFDGARDIQPEDDDV